jgi:hypothetical protein
MFYMILRSSSNDSAPPCAIRLGVSIEKRDVLDSRYHHHRFKHLNLKCIYRIFYKNAKKINSLQKFSFMLDWIFLKFPTVQK